MSDEGYYEIDPSAQDPADPERYPTNYVPWARRLRLAAHVWKAARTLGIPRTTWSGALAREQVRVRELSELVGPREETEVLERLARRLAHRVEANPHLSVVGQFLAWRFGVGQLHVRRAVLEHVRANQAEIEARGKMVAPVIIAGPARSGTTLLQRLLALDPATRAPYTFEMEMPLPPMGPEVEPLSDPRIGAAGAVHSQLDQLAPGFMAKLAESHLWSPTELEESLVYMLMHNGIPLTISLLAGQQTLDELLPFEDKRGLFRYERLFFTMLDAARPAPSHWTLKSPQYGPWLPMVFAEYPDARVVLTHRDPRTTLPSFCRMMESWCVVFDRDGHFDKHRFAALLRPMVEASVNVPMALRADRPLLEKQIVDVAYPEMKADPIGQVKRVYESFDLECTPAFEQRMREYLAGNPQGKHGRARYSLEEYGFDPDDLYASMREYIDRYCPS